MNIRKNVIFNHDNKSVKRIRVYYLFILTHELNSQLRYADVRYSYVPIRAVGFERIYIYSICSIVFIRLQKSRFRRCHGG